MVDDDFFFVKLLAERIRGFLLDDELNRDRRFGRRKLRFVLFRDRNDGRRLARVVLVGVEVVEHAELDDARVVIFRETFRFRRGGRQQLLEFGPGRLHLKIVDRRHACRGGQGQHTVAQLVHESRHTVGKSVDGGQPRRR